MIQEPFEVVRRGYDRGQVDERLNALIGELSDAAVARDAAEEQRHQLARDLSACRSENERLRAERAETRIEINQLTARVAELSTIPASVDGMSERLQQMVQIAHEEAKEIRSRATSSATQILAMAQEEADELRAQSEAERRQFQEERRSDEEALTAQLEESQARLERLRGDADGQRARLEAELAERRSDAEAVLASDLEQQRRATMNELAMEQRQHRDKAARMLDAANQQARTQLAEVRAEVERARAEARDDIGSAQRDLERLRTLQHQVAEQLTAVRALLEWTLPQIGAAGNQPAGLVLTSPDDGRVGDEQNGAPVPAAAVATTSGAGDEGQFGPNRAGEPSPGPVGVNPVGGNKAGSEPWAAVSALVAEAQQAHADDASRPSPTHRKR